MVHFAIQYLNTNNIRPHKPEHLDLRHGLEVGAPDYGVDPLVHGLPQLLADRHGQGPQLGDVGVDNGEISGPEPVVILPGQRGSSRKTSKVDVVLEQHKVSNLVGRIT